MSSFIVKITDASKDGEIVKFTLVTKTKEDDQSEGGKIVLRQYEDFEFLLHYLTTNYDITPVIVPPLPPKPTVIPSNSIESKLKSNPNVTKVASGDEYVHDCKRFEIFMKDILSVQLFAEDEHLIKFLTEEEPAVRAAVKRGIFDSFITLVDNTRYQNYKDSDPDFQVRRDTTNSSLSSTKQFSLVNDKLRAVTNILISHYGSLASTLRNSATLTVQNSKEITRYLGLFADILDELMVNHVETQFITDDTLGSTLELYSRNLQACQAMLFRRTCKLVKLDSATKALEKATPKNHDQLLNAKEEASQSFEDISEKAKEEYEKFTEKKILHYRDTLVDFAERRKKNHEDAIEIISSCLQKLKN